MQLAAGHADRFRAALGPTTHLLRDLIDDAAAAGVVDVDDSRVATALVQQTVMYSWFGNRLLANPDRRVDAEATWTFCRRALGA